MQATRHETELLMLENVIFGGCVVNDASNILGRRCCISVEKISCMLVETAMLASRCHSVSQRVYSVYSTVVDTSVQQQVYSLMVG